MAGTVRRPDQPAAADEHDIVGQVLAFVAACVGLGVGLAVTGEAHHLGELALLALTFVGAQPSSGHDPGQGALLIAGIFAWPAVGVGAGIATAHVIEIARVRLGLGWRPMSEVDPPSRLALVLAAGLGSILILAVGGINAYSSVAAGVYVTAAGAVAVRLSRGRPRSAPRT